MKAYIVSIRFYQGELVSSKGEYDQSFSSVLLYRFFHVLDRIIVYKSRGHGLLNILMIERRLKA